MLLPKTLINVPRPLQIFYLIVLALELILELSSIWRTLVS